ncbi:RING finger protein 39-like [Rhinophrynus dorsalis]
MAAAGSVKELQESTLCPLCGCYFEDPVTTECGHSYCRCCLVAKAGAKVSSGGQLKCPSCGKAMGWKGVTTDVRLGVTTRIARRLNLETPPPRRNKGIELDMPRHLKG